MKTKLTIGFTLNGYTYLCYNKNLAIGQIFKIGTFEEVRACYKDRFINPIDLRPFHMASKFELKYNLPLQPPSYLWV